MFTPHNISHVKFHVSHVTFYMSRVTCHVSHITFFLFLFGQIGETYWSRDCYQRGLPQLVFPFIIFFDINLLSKKRKYVKGNLKYKMFLLHVQHLMFNVKCSMFNVQFPMFNVKIFKVHGSRLTA